MLALLQREEPAATRVNHLFELAMANEVSMSVSIINLGEVTYRVSLAKSRSSLSAAAVDLALL